MPDIEDETELAPQLPAPEHKVRGRRRLLAIGGVALAAIGVATAVRIWPGPNTVVTAAPEPSTTTTASVIDEPVPDAVAPPPEVSSTTVTSLAVVTTTIAPTPWHALRPASGLDESGIYVLEPRGGRLSKLVIESELVPNGAFSPDGLRVAFGVADRLEVVGLDGSGRRTLVPGGVAPSRPLWSPDATTIAFLGRDPDGYRLKVVDVKSGGVRVLAAEMASVRAFDWSADGTSLLFGTLDPGIHAVNADGTGLRLHRATAQQVMQIFWSPTGHRVLYTSNGRVFTYDPAGGPDREIGFDPGGPILDPWAPDGSRFAIGRGFRYSLFGADGGEQSVAQPAITLAWSPDGGWLLTRREQPGAPPPGPTQRSMMDLVVMRPDGADVRTILADRITDRAWHHDFEWRPQGDLIVLSVSSYRPDYLRYDRN